MERYYDGDRYDGHVDGEAQVREERPLICAVVSCIAVGVVEEEGAEEGEPCEDG